MTHISQGENDLYLRARNIAVAISFGKETGQSCYAKNPFPSDQAFINALAAHIRYISRLGDPNGVLTKEIKDFLKLCGQASADSVKKTEEKKRMRVEEQKEVPVIIGDIDIDEVRRFAHWTKFVAQKPEVELQEDRLGYLTELLSFIENLPDRSFEVEEFYQKACTAITGASRPSA